MDQPQPLVIRLNPNAVVHERQDGVWFQSDSPVVFQHADICTIPELEAVFLYHLEGGFTEIRKVGYCYLQRQPDGRLMPQHVMDFSVEVGRIPVVLPVAATPVRIANPPLWKQKRRWVSQSQRRMIPTMLRARHHPLTLRKVVRAVRKPGQLAAPVTSFRPRRQFQWWRTCHVFFQ
ncbi:hypothetical protein PIB30_033010 [Stylosanthes scabra]|uniref:Uncharacterized protein n=1 Tax=Stylosanthes scabra TaxID=79078 RepID=A0ABU6VC36_9FABA|nr:hypothetical protein [Stylosanthes scabra]